MSHLSTARGIRVDDHERAGAHTEPRPGDFRGPRRSRGDHRHGDCGLARRAAQRAGHEIGEVRALRWWLRLTGLLTLLGGVACVVAEPTWLPALIVGIGLVVYGIAALSTEVGPRAAKR